MSSSDKDFIEFLFVGSEELRIKIAQGLTGYGSDKMDR